MTIASCDGSALDCNKMIRDYRKLEDRWEELKTWIEEGRGGNFRTADILRKMKELEEK